MARGNEAKLIFYKNLYNLVVNESNEGDRSIDRLNPLSLSINPVSNEYKNRKMRYSCSRNKNLGKNPSMGKFFDDLEPNNFSHIGYKKNHMVKKLKGKSFKPFASMQGVKNINSLYEPMVVKPLKLWKYGDLY